MRVDTVKGEDVSVRGLVLLRDLLSPALAERAEETERERARVDASAASDNVMTVGLRSPGRAVLAVNGALFGAYVAYSVQRSSGSDDPRVLYPLLALGTGVGLGGALLVSDEWDLSTGDAWFLSAGAWWSAGAGVLIANGRHVEPLTDRYAWGVGAGIAGLGLATFALTRSKMDEGDAVLTHSGGAIGLFLGSLADLAYRGTLDATPYSGARAPRGRRGGARRARGRGRGEPAPLRERHRGEDARLPGRDRRRNAPRRRPHLAPHARHVVTQERPPRRRPRRGHHRRERHPHRPRPRVRRRLAGALLDNEGMNHEGTKDTKNGKGDWVKNPNHISFSGLRVPRVFVVHLAV